MHRHQRDALGHVLLRLGRADAGTPLISDAWPDFGSKEGSVVKAYSRESQAATFIHICRMDAKKIGIYSPSGYR